ncbi:MAG: RNA methyltransferase [Treponema sp.]|nr:RNA methyltransferase [Treponema sp.]
MPGRARLLLGSMIPTWLSDLATLRDRDLAAEGLVVAEGRLAAERLIARSAIEAYEPLALLATPGAAENLEVFDSRAGLAARWPFFVASEAELSELAGFPFHRGIIAIAMRPPPLHAEALAETMAGRGLPPLLVLPRTRDPENLGALARSAAALGFGGMLLGPPCPDFLSRRALRVSMGAVLAMPCARLGSPEAWKAFASRGYALAGAVIDQGATEAAAWEPRAPCALALGDEYAGLDQAWLAVCDEKITIAMAMGPDSLNVAAAGAILMWRASLAAARGPLA